MNRIFTVSLNAKNGLKPIAETDASGNVVSFFVYGSSPLTPDYMTRDGNTYRLIRDHVGSVRLVIDTATGTIAQRIDYDSFGNVVSDSAPGFQPFGFQSGLYDNDTGFVQFGARWYDPITGRWLSKDPLLLAAGWNVYAFCANNPVNFVDPFGLCEDYNPWSDPAVGKSVWDSIRDQFSFDPNRSGLAQIQQSGGGGTAWETAYWNAIGVSVSGVSGAFGANLFNAGAASVFFTPMASETLAAGAGTTVSQTLGGQLLVMLNVQSRVRELCGL